MMKYIGEISCKTLSSTLRELEADGLIRRKEYPQIPPKVEYSLSKKENPSSPSWTKCVTGEKRTGSNAGKGNKQRSGRKS